MTDFSTAQKRVRGLGASKSGVHHWIVQRFTAVFNIINVLWLLYALTQLADFDFTAAYSFMAQPFNSVMAILFSIFGFYHAKLGLQVVIEDYIHHKCIKVASLLGVNIIIYGCMISSVFGILKIAL
jgi:succinate dehydrogenase / fumarate reductase, membrane anchor subunit